MLFDSVSRRLQYFALVFHKSMLPEVLFMFLFTFYFHFLFYFIFMEIYFSWNHFLSLLFGKLGQIEITKLSISVSFYFLVLVFLLYDVKLLFAFY